MSEEEGVEDADDNNLNGTMTVEDMEGVVGYSGGNGDVVWESLQNIAPSGAFFIEWKNARDNCLD